ncbi:Ig-like domain-containing protein [Microbacterium sp. zg.Y1084]|uniref:Ig-like domain repeat protein n=1 Tax=Microbacterium sp. zg.Y1084 TaxID=2969667 RepID=UPI00214AC6AC|nr:Ig-like domain-containing protein [Microbacterium sp. zg.Y1084]MCR2814170.1 Ig-like domain-containing protein [Microbacterium sp. zg.Y1084]
MIQLFHSPRNERGRTEASSRPSPRLRSRVAVVTAAAVALSSLGFGVATPAYAAPLSQQIWEFSNTEDWHVPAGVSKIVVGLRGGYGGNVDRVNGGRGADFAVELPVSRGDVVTVVPGKPANKRKGGDGWIKGGDGGKSSLSGAEGGGGGGAAAVIVNGQVVAVAGGGGGGGGYTGNPGFSITPWGLLKMLEAFGGYSGSSDTGSGLTFVPGGDGASSGQGSRDGYTVTMYPATWGAGPHSTKPGENGRDDTKFARYHKDGGNGTSAATSTAGGGGGGGGGGWPASGTGGGPGRKFMSYSAGSGGGAGMSWVDRSYPGAHITSDARRPEDMHDYFGPLADSGTVRIMVPVTTTTTITGPSQVEAGQDFSLRVRTSDTRTPNTPLDTWVDVYRDATRVAWRSTDGDGTFEIPGLPAGTYQFRAASRPHTDQRDFRFQSTLSEATMTVTVSEPVPPPPPGPSEVASTTTMDIGTAPATFGDTLSAEVSVEVAGGIDVSGETVTIEVDGVAVGAGTLADAGDGVFTTVAPVTHVPHVGPHEVVARFDGVQDSDPGTTDVLPSVSTTESFTVARAATSTTITQARTSVRAFGRIDVTATVQAGSTPVGGQVALQADGGPLAYGTADSAGEVLFEDVVLPWGTEDLTVAFLGDADGDYALSTSAPHGITVTAIGTMTTLTLSTASLRADDPLTLSATVTNAMLGVDTDPRGSLEILFDGEVVYSMSTGMDSDPDADDGEARYVIAPDTLPVGSHSVTARFVPAPGFAASTSTATPLEVRGIPTALTPRATEVSGTTKKPATIEVDAVVALGASARTAAAAGPVNTLGASAGDPVGGHIEAYLGADPLAAAEVADGAGQLALSGLPVGTHEVRLRFVPDSAEMLESSATVTVTVTAPADGGGSDDGGDPDDSETDGGGGGGDQSDGPDAGDRDALPATGGELGGLWAVALLLILGGAVILAASRRRRAAADRA